MQKQASDWPPFLAPLRSALERLHPPDGEFDPQGEWEHHYTECVLQPARQAKKESVLPYGTLVLKRKPVQGGGCILDVNLQSTYRANSQLLTRVSMTCAGDRLTTPQKWDLRADITEHGKLMGELVVAETGTLQNGTILRRGKVPRKIAAPRPFTSNWSLLEAVQRLPFEQSKPLDFDLYEDLDIYKAGQRLVCTGPFTLNLGGRSLTLHGFRQTGRGILPTHYWLDEQHRLIAAAGALRGFIWDPNGSLARNKERA